jgi:hypothetical protein
MANGLRRISLINSYQRIPTQMRKKGGQFGDSGGEHEANTATEVGDRPACAATCAKSSPKSQARWITPPSTWADLLLRFALEKYADAGYYHIFMERWPGIHAGVTWDALPRRERRAAKG